MKKDQTTAPDLQAHHQGAGPIRWHRPIYQDFLPPCNHACPAGENIQAWLASAMEGRFEEAWRLLTRDNPFPAIMGRVCYHPCETSCNRGFHDKPVSIHAIERSLGDQSLAKSWKHWPPKEETGKKVLIIGGGPSGLSAAYHLRKHGHTVTIHEAGPVLGGMMHFGIPAYRLPRDIMEQEIQKVVDLGVEIHLNSRVDDLLKVKNEGDFDAAFVAIGAHLSKKIDIPQNEAGKILDALSFLKDVEAGAEIKLGRRVAIYGGGNTAMDAARTAKRLGYEPIIIYRRDREHMPAHDFEAEEALAEGVKINWLRTIKEIDQTTFKVEVMKINPEGRPVPTGEFETLEADALILALGQDTDTRFLQNIEGVEFERDGTVIVSPQMMTGHDGIFAGGDMVPSERTVTVAIGHGKKAAGHIHQYLLGIPSSEKVKNPVVGFDRLHVWYGTESPQKEQREVVVEERLGSFDEIKLGFSESEAVYEAQRCFSCGNCFECDACFGSCPEGAVIKLGKGKRYEFDYEKCTGCAICYEQCPCHAIEMIEEEMVDE
jgi:NADPH-dependent glutamate synthase beta subunit-like oxidoreductase